MNQRPRTLTKGLRGGAVGSIDADIADTKESEKTKSRETDAF